MLEFQNITVAKEKHPILNKVSFSVPEHSLTVLIGMNGAGKTTIANCLCRQQDYHGNITLNGKEISQYTPRDLAKKISVLPQLLPNPGITVEELVSYGRNPYLGINRHLNSDDIRIIDNAMQMADCANIRNRILPTLSGGERQKAFLAMNLAQQTDVIVLDEPTSHLDAVAEMEFLTLLKELTNSGKTVLLVMHNLTLAVKFADNIVILDQNACVFSGTKEDCLQQQSIEKTFSVRRFDACQSDNADIFFLAYAKKQEAERH